MRFVTTAQAAAHDTSIVSHAASILADAFVEDPAMIYAVPNEERRRSVVVALQPMLIRYGALYGRVDLSPGEDAVAVWLPPGQEKMTLPRMLRAGMAATPLYLGPRAFWRLNRFAWVKKELHKRAIAVPHWYLVAIGVARRSQGIGTGGRLLDAGTSRAEDTGSPCYLETSLERNVTFFSKHGFRVVVEDEVPDSLRIWGMIREPAQSPSAGPPAGQPAA